MNLAKITALIRTIYPHFQVEQVGLLSFVPSLEWVAKGGFESRKYFIRVSEVTTGTYTVVADTDIIQDFKSDFNEKLGDKFAFVQHSMSIDLKAYQGELTFSIIKKNQQKWKD